MLVIERYPLLLGNIVQGRGLGDAARVVERVPLRHGQVVLQWLTEGPVCHHEDTASRNRSLLPFDPDFVPVNLVDAGPDALYHMPTRQLWSLSKKTLHMLVEQVVLAWMIQEDPHVHDVPAPDRGD